MNRLYSFHIQFTDGSNPYYHFPCNYSKHAYAIRKWRRMYDMKVLNRTPDHVNFLATYRVNTPQINLFR